jgi:hypothetical protein
MARALRALILIPNLKRANAGDRLDVGAAADEKLSDIAPDFLRVSASLWHAKFW